VSELTVQAKKKGDVYHTVLGDELNIYTASEQKEELLNLLDDARELEIDLSKVAEMDSAGLQILIMLKQEAERQDKQLRLINHSQAVFEVFELLDVSSVFGDPVVIPAEWRS
jgi:anti-anti-sigma factor